MYTEYSSDPGYFRINTSQLMSPDDFHDLRMPKTESGTPVCSFIVREKKMVMTVAPGCIVYFMEVSPEIVSILGFEYGNYSGGLKRRQFTGTKNPPCRLPRILRPGGPKGMRVFTLGFSLIFSSFMLFSKPKFEM